MGDEDTKQKIQEIEKGRLRRLARKTHLEAVQHHLREAAIAARLLDWDEYKLQDEMAAHFHSAEVEEKSR